MNANRTELVLILDQSGSMEHLRDETITMVNAVVADQLAQSGEHEELDLTLALFNTKITVIADGMRVERSGRPFTLTPEQYVPDGYTALHDAVVSVIERVGKRLASRAEAERPAAVVVAIITDGEENASRRHTLADVRRVIEHQRDVYSWQFLYLGANQDSWAVGQGMGLMREDTKDWSATPDGVKDMSVMMMKDVTFRKNIVRKGRS